MITADLDRALGVEPSSAATWRPAEPSSPGPESVGSAPAPGVYATSVAFLLAQRGPQSPAQIAARLARRLRGLDWVADATATGDGYLTVAVTADALARLAVRMAQAGQGCVRSGALRGATVTAHAQPRLAEADGWVEARDRLASHITGRLAEAAGAAVTWVDDCERPTAAVSPAPGADASESSGPRRVRTGGGTARRARSGAQNGPAADPGMAAGEHGDTGGASAARGSARPGRAGGASRPGWAGDASRPGPAGPAEDTPAARGSARPGPGPGPGPGGAGSPVAEAIAYAGADAVAIALILAPRRTRAPIDPAAAAARVLGNPAYAVRYAHAHAASALRQAADLGLVPGDAAGFVPRLLAHPDERALLHELSWLPERAAGAARRGQPDAFARYLIGLARTYLSCQESCPAAWPGMAAPDGSWSVPAAAGLAPAGPAAGRPGVPPGESLIVARLWLAAAARAALAAGLGLLGVQAPDRL